MLLRIGLLLVLAGCERGTPTLQGDNVVLTLTAEPNTILNLGSQSLIHLRAFRTNGMPIPSGTPVFLTTTGGFIPAEVDLVEGEASVVFRSGVDTGTIAITAQSGEVTASVSVEVVQKLVEVGNVSLLLNPTNLLEVGGVVDAAVVVTDTEGRPIPDMRVVLSSDFGRFDGNGAVLFTNGEGIASDTLRIIGGLAPPAQVTVSAQVENQVVQGVVTLTPNQNPVPVILFSPSEVFVDEPVLFDGGASSDPDGTIDLFRWSFGDGASASGRAVSHVYRFSGTYSAVLEVFDNLGASQTATATVVVNDQPANIAPVASFTFSPAAPGVDQEVSFDAVASSDSDGTIVDYFWNFGEPGATGQGLRTSHAYSSSGTYTVTLTVVDDRGAGASTTQQIAITGNQAPTAAFTISPATGRPGQDFTFDGAASMDADGTIVSYLYDFGDGARIESAVPQVRHAYSAAGTYGVFLTVVDDDGGLGFTSQSLTVNDSTPPTAAFTFAPDPPGVGELVRFDASTSTAPEGTIVSFSWRFGDGSLGTGREVTHAYTATGQYTVRLRVVDNLGVPDESVQIVTVGGDNPPQPCLVVTQTGDYELSLDASCTTDAEDPIDDLILIFEAVAPSGVQVVISGSGSVRAAAVSADGSTAGTAFTLVFILTVIDTDNNEAQTPETFLFVVPST